MNITIFTGSGHSNSACFKLAQKINQDFISNERLSLYDAVDLNVNDCLGCDYCLAHQNECVISDDMEEIYENIRQADKIIIISAVYFSNIPSVLKRIIDRCQMFYNLKDRSDIKPKDVLAICLGGAPGYSGQFDAFEQTYRVLFPDFNAKLFDFIKVPNTDKVDIFSDQETLDKINEAVQKFLE